MIPNIRRSYIRFPLGPNTLDTLGMNNNKNLRVYPRVIVLKEKAYGYVLVHVVMSIQVQMNT